MTQDTPTRFHGFQGPNYTQVPDAVFDELLPDLSGAELKVLLYIIRRTFGFKRTSDHISLSQMLRGIRTKDGRELDRGVGLTKKTLLAAINSLEAREVIVTERRRSVDHGDEPTTYRLNVVEGTRGVETTPPVGEKVHHGGGVETPPGPWGKKYTTQETGLQETGLQETGGNPSNFRKGSRQDLGRENDVTERVRPATRAPRAALKHVEEPLPQGRLGLQKPRRGAHRAAEARDTNPDETDGVLGHSAGQHEGHALTGLTRLGDVLFAERATGLTPAVDPVPAAPEESEDASPEYIENVIRDLSHELSDAIHIRANVTQAHRLHAQSGLSVKAFVEVLYAVRRTTRLQADVKRPMPYFFKLVKVQLGLAPNPHKNRQRDAAEQSRPQRTSLAGKYAHLVRR